MSSGSAASSSSAERASADPWVPTGIEARVPTGCAMTRQRLVRAFDDPVVAEVGKEPLRARTESQAPTARVRDRDVLDLIGVQRERDSPEPVEVLDADAVELRVASEQGQQLEFSGGVLHLGPELAHRVEDQEPLVVRAGDVARGEIVTVAGEGEGLGTGHVPEPGIEVRTRVRVVHDCRNVDVDAADAVDETE